MLLLASCRGDATIGGVGAISEAVAVDGRRAADGGTCNIWAALRLSAGHSAGLVKAPCCQLPGNLSNGGGPKLAPRDGTALPATPRGGGGPELPPCDSTALPAPRPGAAATRKGAWACN